MNFALNFFSKSIINSVNFLQQYQSPVKNIVCFYHRRRFIRRYGYAPHYHSKGLLPRLKDEHFPLRCSPNEKKADPWRKNVALFGQNDYIDIFTRDKIHPTDTMGSIPVWLRKFRGNEMQMLIRRRKAKAHWSWFRPQKWNELNKRIDFLYKRLNYKTAPRKPEYPAGY